MTSLRHNRYNLTNPITPLIIAISQRNLEGLTTWQGCSDPKTDPYTIKAAVRKEERRQVVVYK